MQLGRKCHVVLSSQLEPTWALILVSSLLLARGIASLGALTVLAASMQHGRKPFLCTVCSQNIPPLDRFSSFCPATSWSKFFRHSSCIHLLAFQPRLHVHTSCDRMLTNEVTLISMSTHVAPSAATIAPRSIPRRYVYTSRLCGLPAADVGSMSRLHPSTLSNLLRSSYSNI